MITVEPLDKGHIGRQEFLLGVGNASKHPPRGESYFRDF